MTLTTQATGLLARTCCKLHLPLCILKSGAGYYVGTANDCGPVSRESQEYWPSQANAAKALEDGTWTQRQEP
nr:hypothetical protein [Nitrogeniibacter aestuarii]